MPTPALLGPPQQCACNAFIYGPFGDHLQTCQTKSAASQVHDWVVYKLGAPTPLAAGIEQQGAGLVSRFRRAQVEVVGLVSRPAS